MDIFIFKLESGSRDTGPLGAAEGDYYIYIESSSPRVNGEKAILTTEDVSFPGSCLLKGLSLLKKKENQNVMCFRKFPVPYADLNNYT